MRAEVLSRFMRKKIEQRKLHQTITEDNRSIDYNSQNKYNIDDDKKTVVKFAAGGRLVTSHSKTDSFGRKSFDELQLGTGFVSRQFHYHAGEATKEHKTGGKLKSSATTNLVSQIVLSDGRTLSYEYDKEERITKVTDSIDGVTEYAYDEQGQLVSESRNGEEVVSMTYNHYGNILSKNGKAYAYGDKVWKDKLTAYDGQSITYDAQGNPVSYLGHTLTWEKGRQLKSFDTNIYTYNANGIRTSKTIAGVKHTYDLEGTKILVERWGSHTLVPLYDNEDGVCGILYDNVPYYFYKNLQGDVIAIADKDGEPVARYTYDAWGVCTVTLDISPCAISAVNPYRYRGYYYDAETGLYYLQSRYYDPVVGRFICADDPDTLSFSVDCDSIIGNNLFTYCLNFPINNSDITGLWLARLVCGLAGAAVFGTLAYVVCKVVGMFVPISKKTTAAITVAFAALGGIIGAVLGPSFMLKHAPKLLQAINKIEKKKFSLKGFGPNTGGNIFGIIISDTLIIMLHQPHPKYKEWYYHIQVEVKIGRKQFVIWKKPIVYVNPKTWGK